MDKKFTHIETLFIHGGEELDRENGATRTPIYQNAAFGYQTAQDLADVFSGKSPGYLYSRIANPTVSSLERRVMVLEKGVGAVATSSGMSAISLLATTLAGSGEQIVASKRIFGGTYSLFTRTLPHLGIETTLVDCTDLQAIAGAITQRCRFIFVETIGNPAMEIPHIAGIAQIAKEAGIPLVVDSTVTTPYLIQPGELGADIVIHSSTKFMSGHGTAIGGIIVDCGSFNWAKGSAQVQEYVGKVGPSLALIAALKLQYLRDMGSCQAPMNAFLQSTGLESLGVRLERQCSNAFALARFLDSHPRVGYVNYPGLEDNKFHELAKSQFNGKFGAILTFSLEDQNQCFQVIDKLQLASNLANLGESRTLVIHPASTICHSFTETEQKAMGVTPGLIRVCVGLEHHEDIVADFNNSLNSLRGD